MTTSDTAAAPPPTSGLVVPPASWAGLAVATGLVAGCRVAGTVLTGAGFDLHLGDAWPLHGFWRPADTGPPLFVAVIVAGLGLWYAPRLAASLRWGRLLAAAYLAAVAWTIALAVSDGVAGLTRPLASRHEYPSDLDRVTDLGGFLPTFADHIVGEPRWVAHVGGHPPGAFGTFVVLDRIGLGGGVWPGVVCVLIGAVAVPAVLSTVRLLGTESLSRRAAPFLVFAPAALWIAVSADALFTGVSAAGICALAHAARRRGPGSDGLAVAGGLALGVTLFLSYGLTLLGPLAIAVVAVQRRFRPLVIGGLGVAAVVAGFAAAGFLWWDGLALTVERVHLGAAWRDRPQPYFWFANLAALAIAVGPAVVSGLPLLARHWRGGTIAARAATAGRAGNLAGADSVSVPAAGAGETVRADSGAGTGQLVRTGTAWLVLPAAGLLAIGLAGVSGLTTGEVERIYLPFAVWLIPAAALLPARTGRGWLAAQLIATLTLEALLRLSW